MNLPRIVGIFQRFSSTENVAKKFFLLFSFLIIMGLVGRSLPDIDLSHFPVDYGNYIHGIQLLLHGVNPYGPVEFFAPPWIAFIFSPYFLLKNPLFWQITCALFVFALLLILYTQLEKTLRYNKWSLLVLAGLFFLPTTLFSITLGQLSSLIGLVLTFLFICLIQGKVNKWDFAFGLILLSLKPHIVFLPVLILALELIRRKLWSTLLIASITITILALASTITLYKDWLSAYLEALFVTRRYLGGQGLAASFYFNLANIGINYFVFIPHLLYAFMLWLRKGVSLYLFSFLTALNFLIIPYSRQYDYAILLPAYIFIFAKLLKLRRPLALSVGYLTIFFVPFFTKLYFLIPLIVLIALLFLVPEHLRIQNLGDMVRAKNWLQPEQSNEKKHHT